MQGHLWRHPAHCWLLEEWEAGWDPCKNTDGRTYLTKDYAGYSGLWALVQSRLHIAAEEIWRRLEACFGAERCEQQSAEEAAR